VAAWSHCTWCSTRRTCGPTPEGVALLGRIEEIVRRGRVRGFIPWLITQRPAVLHKDVLSQADIMIAMKLTSDRDRSAAGAWIEGQANRQEEKRTWPTCRDCRGAKATSGRQGARCCSGCAFRRSTLSTVRARRRAASASPCRARWRRWT
jgi:hypothetical protein